ncbi:hypothetical protein C900_00374 [Fulvivirga imtechensis AK7]|uniref:histidine kinase n=1 Tax=Fulvivirga imtechensis AK7 TaxID=1237149 RepID=L8JJN1_9BACT|nr:PAS domain-containing sensor histidine kinase [Fulvivirga imtechensis]ELR68453.1 hypothetical protein C900_00374 [Fulvivirga imtechensis AK7]
MKRSFYRNLFIGKDNYIESWPLYKRVILTGQISSLCISAGIFYFLFDFINGSLTAFFTYVFLVVFSLLSFFLNRNGFYVAAKVIVLLTGNIAVFTTFEIELYGTGSFVFFIPCILGAFTLFGYDERTKSYMFSALSIGLFLLSLFYDFEFIPSTDFPENNVNVNFVINFILSCLTCIFMIGFLLRINSQSEGSLIKSESALRKTAEELNISKKRFELAIQGSGAGIWDWNASDDRLYISPYLANLLDYDLDEVQHLTRSSFLQVIHEDDRELFKKRLEDHLKWRLPFKVECRFRKGDGSYIWVLDTGQAQWHKNGRPTRMVGSIIDITERKQAEEKVKEQNLMLEKTNAELDRFVYSTSHDLRAPLSSVLGLINITRMSENIDEHKRCLDMMKDRIHTLNGFIADIIDYSRNSRLSVIKEPVVLNDLVQESISNLQYFQQSQQIRITCDGVEDITFIGDRSRLKIILNNIIANAIKYHNIDQADPYVHITARQAGRWLEIIVSDNGEGIDPELLDRIFEMFFRANERSEGSGLGLYIAKEMADKLSGQIKVNSVIGSGTTFTLRIPVDHVNDSIQQDSIA